MRKAIILILSYLALILYLNHSSPLLYWDENSYLANARAHISDSPYKEEFRFPLLSWTIAGIWKVTGESVAAAKAFAIIMAIAGAFLFYLICRTYFDETGALVATGLFCANPLVIEWGPRIYTDIPGLTLALAGFYMLIRSSNLLHITSAGAIFGLAFLMRVTNALLFLSIGIVIIARLAKTRKIRTLNKGLALLLGFMIAISPWLIYNKLVHKKFLWNVIQYNNVIQGQVWGNISAQAINMLKTFGPLIIPIIMGAWLVIRERDKRMYIPALFLLIYSAYITFLVTVKLERYVLPLVPFAIILGYYGIKKGIRDKRWQIATTFLIIGFALAASAMTLTGLITDGTCRADGAIIQGIEYISENTDPHDKAVSNVWPWFGYYNNLDAIYTWTTDIESYKDTYRAEYIIIHDTIGEPFDTGPVEQSRSYQHATTFYGCDGSLKIYKARD